jgi:predicted Zn-dependent protease
MNIEKLYKQCQLDIPVEDFEAKLKDDTSFNKVVDLLDKEIMYNAEVWKKAEAEIQERIKQVRKDAADQWETLFKDYTALENKLKELEAVSV